MRAKVKDLWSRQFVRNVVHTLGSKGVIIAIGTISSILLTRGLGPEGKGIYSVILTLVVIGYQFGHLGLQTSNTYFISRDKSLFGRIMINSIIVALMTSTVMFGILYFLNKTEPDLFKIPSNINFRLYMLAGIPASLLSLYFKNIMYGLQSFKQINYIEIASRTAYTSLLCLLYFSGHLSISSAFTLYILENILVILFVAIYSVRNVPSSYKPSMNVFRSNLKYGIKAYLTVVLSFLVVRSDILIVNYYMDSSHVGFYSTSVQLVDQFKLFGSVTASVLLPRLASVQDIKEKYRLNMKVVRQVIIILLGLGAISILLAKPLIQILYGDAFLPSVESFRVLIVATIFLSIETIIAQFLAAIGLPFKLILFWIICFILNIILNIILIPKFGEVGAAYASLISYMLILILVFNYTRSLIQKNKEVTDHVQ